MTFPQSSTFCINFAMGMFFSFDKELCMWICGKMHFYFVQEWFVSGFFEKIVALNYHVFGRCKKLLFVTLSWVEVFWFSSRNSFLRHLPMINWCVHTRSTIHANATLHVNSLMNRAHKDRLVLRRQLLLTEHRMAEFRILLGVPRWHDVVELVLELYLLDRFLLHTIQKWGFKLLQFLHLLHVFHHFFLLQFHLLNVLLGRPVFNFQLKF